MTFFWYTAKYVKTYSACFISRDIYKKFLIVAILKNNQNTIGGAMAVASYPNESRMPWPMHICMTNIIFIFPNVNLDLNIKLAIHVLQFMSHISRCGDLYYSFVMH